MHYSQKLPLSLLPLCASPTSVPVCGPLTQVHMWVYLGRPTVFLNCSLHCSLRHSVSWIHGFLLWQSLLVTLPWRSPFTFPPHPPTLELEKGHPSYPVFLWVPESWTVSRLAQQVLYPLSSLPRPSCVFKEWGLIKSGKNSWHQQQDVYLKEDLYSNQE